MSRPLKTRTTVSYNRDIENLNRLRGAILLDLQLFDRKEAVVVMREIDALIVGLRSLVQIKEEISNRKSA